VNFRGLPVSCNSRTAIATQVGRTRQAAIVTWSLSIFTLHTERQVLSRSSPTQFFRLSLFLSLPFYYCSLTPHATAYLELHDRQGSSDQAARRIRTDLRPTTMERRNVALAYLELWRGAPLARSARPSAALGRLRHSRDSVGTQVRRSPRRWVVEGKTTVSRARRTLHIWIFSTWMAHR